MARILAALDTPTEIDSTRRQFLALGGAIATLSFWPKTVFATETHRIAQGDFDITVLSDGYITLPADIIMPEASPAERTDILKRLGGNADSAPAPANIPVIRTAKDIVVIDVGSGTNFQATAGTFGTNFDTTGIDPKDATKVVFTHAHPDHTGGTLTEAGKLRFPNAEYFVSEKEWAFWTDPDFETKMPKALHDFARGAQRDLFAVKDRVNLVKDGDDIVTGMRVLDTAGHTPGHISLELAGGDGLIISADAATNRIVSFEHPGWKFGFDTEQDVAIRNRQALMDRAATDRIKLLGYHWTYPGIGYAERKGTGYRFAAA
ncbi:MAG TPA: MBL fold metallo-hydrolase [Pararhizobium sp.]|uniref:MBL fold metallo-hydrolase n=1 Tax=Pararhizobium sp. TaxID=1977563 RepID=UPI002B6B3961|nr:MBL fold metallo-hydrolase [Pararhizobium sp.]HTO31233.1 MBL fold metallo-hydrolase [Pararhizobium sp.]